MNNTNKIIFSLCTIYEYAKDINDLMYENNWDFDLVTNSTIYFHGMNFCFLKMGESAEVIKDLDIELFENKYLGLYELKNLKDEIKHIYSSGDNKALKLSPLYIFILYEIPKIIEKIEELVPETLLKNPYALMNDDEDYSRVVSEIYEKLNKVSQELWA